ncbi:MAG: PTS mannitol transporter subunit IICB [Clostridium sp.]|uniref:PTS mannitol transporter subunit IICB n=1 Tax=Clostridium sp. TaxID=1506 RepID=UPI003D6CC3F0
MSKRAKIQAFGGFLTGMVLPNIGAFIAWGLITAIFIPTGWFPNAEIAKMVSPMITYLLPLLIAYTGGKAIGGKRGGVMGAIATMGVITGSSIPMFMGAMVIGPLGGYVIKKFDKAIDGKIPAGFEMIVNNFSMGIIGMILAIISFLAIGPAILSANAVVKAGIEAMVHANLIPLLAIINEPAKVLFLNNAIDQGIYAPIGVQDALIHGKSIYFMLASSPGPGLGLLLAFWLFGKGTSKESAPTAIIIHFFGGIHEMYFPYVLMKPIMVIPMILGGMSGIFTFKTLSAGLVAFPSPGSIFSFLAMTPRGGFISTIAGVTVGTIVTFLVSSFILKLDNKVEGDVDFQASQDLMKELKGVKKVEQADIKQDVTEIKQNVMDVKLIVFACDAGMGSSAMGAALIRKKLDVVGLDIKVINKAIEKIPLDADIVICHESLLDRAKKVAPDVEFITIKNFIAAPEYDKLVERLSKIEHKI